MYHSEPWVLFSLFIILYDSAKNSIKSKTVQIFTYWLIINILRVAYLPFFSPNAISTTHGTQIWLRYFPNLKKNNIWYNTNSKVGRIFESFLYLKWIIPAWSANKSINAQTFRNTLIIPNLKIASDRKYFRVGKLSVYLDHCCTPKITRVIYWKLWTTKGFAVYQVFWSFSCEF